MQLAHPFAAGTALVVQTASITLGIQVDNNSNQYLWEPRSGTVILPFSFGWRFPCRPSSTFDVPYEAPPGVVQPAAIAAQRITVTELSEPVLAVVTGRAYNPATAQSGIQPASLNPYVITTVAQTFNSNQILLPDTTPFSLGQTVFISGSGQLPTVGKVTSILAGKFINIDQPMVAAYPIGSWVIAVPVVSIVGTQQNPLSVAPSNLNTWSVTGSQSSGAALTATLANPGNGLGVYINFAGFDQAAAAGAAAAANFWSITDNNGVVWARGLVATGAAGTAASDFDQDVYIPPGSPIPGSIFPITFAFGGAGANVWQALRASGIFE